MDRKGSLVLDGSEAAAGLLIGGASESLKKSVSFSRTDSFSEKLVVPDQNENEEEKIVFLNGEYKQESSEERKPGSFSDDDEDVEGKLEKKAKNNNNKPPFTGWKRYLGMGLAITASVIFSLTIVIVKALNKYHTFSIGVWRFQGVLLPSLPIILLSLLRKKGGKICEPIHPLCERSKLKTFLYLFLRALFGCAAVLFHFTSLKYMNISDATVIAFCTPVFVTFLAYVLLGEACGVVNILSALVTLLGVGIITRPPFLTGEEKMDTQLLTGAGFALASMCCASLTFLSLRLLKGVNVSIVTFFFGMYGSIECVILSAIVGQFDLPQGSWDWFLAVVLAILTFIGQVCTTLALKYEEAGPIALCRSCDVIFSFIWQLIFFNVIPTIFSFVGASVVLFGVMMVGFRKYISMLPDNHPSKKTYWFMLK